MEITKLIIVSVFTNMTLVYTSKSECMLLCFRLFIVSLLNYILYSSHLLIRHKWKCLYQMLVNIMIFSVPIEQRCELLRYSVGSGRMT
jgi:hypothetical protein